MSRCRGYYVLLLATLLAGVTSVISKFVCIGKSIPLFQNLTFGSLKTDVFLYKTSSGRKQLLAIWSNPKFDKGQPPIRHYEKRLVFDDKAGNIVLEQFLPSDEATYVIKYDINGVNVTQDVKIVALVAPNETCKPKIKLESSTVLSASRGDDNCGKPSVSVQWKDNPGISRKINTVIKLHPGKEAGTYYACLDGPALDCVNSTMKLDYCSNFTIEENCYPTVISETSDTKTTALIVMGTCLAVVSVVAVIFIFLCCKMKKRKHYQSRANAMELRELRGKLK